MILRSQRLGLGRIPGASPTGKQAIEAQLPQVFDFEREQAAGSVVLFRVTPPAMLNIGSESATSRPPPAQRPVRERSRPAH